MKRQDDYLERRKHLQNLSEAELEERFWSLIGDIVDPILELARNNTTPSVERSVLLRMGFSSLEAKTIVDGAIDRNLISKGCGHLVYRLSKEKNISIREAGLSLINNKNWEFLQEIFKKEA